MAYCTYKYQVINRCLFIKGIVLDEIVIDHLVCHHHHTTGRAQTKQFGSKTGEQGGCAFILSDLFHKSMTTNIVVLSTGQPVDTLNTTLGHIIWNVDC